MKRVLVVGDTLVDNYVFGDVFRISPEAPIPVLDVSHESKLLGGAANVAANIVSLTGTTFEIDYFGFVDWFVEEKLKSFDIRPTGVPVSVTDMLYKNRFVCNRHQLLRVDNKKKYDKELCLVSDLKFCSIDLSIYDVIIVSDYDKGTFSKEVFNHIQASNKLILADLKKRKEYYNSETLKNIILKCNMKEYNEEFGAIFDLFKDTVLTHGKDGYELSFDSEKIYPAKRLQSEIIDVVGAGDVFLAGMVANFLEEGYDLEKMCKFGNRAAGEKVKHFGTTVVKRGWVDNA
jgi:rfaE bifunctional protein kinase chain/domain